MLNINPNLTKNWNILFNHYRKIKNRSIFYYFKKDNNRFKDFSIFYKKLILFDFSKNLINNNTIKIFINFLNEINFKKYINGILKGYNYNITENKIVSNFLLRDVNNYFSKNNYLNKNLLLEKEIIDKNLLKIKKITNDILKNNWLGFSNKKIFNIVNIGIGGSDLGPRMIIKSLSLYKKKNINTFFVSNLDVSDINSVLNLISPENTIFIICSKTFTTEETLLNFKISREWILNFYNNNIFSLNKHFILITSNLKNSLKYNICRDNILLVNNWVGGRYSFCSAFGLSISLSLGFKNFKKILKGCHDLDKHFFFEKYNKNIPILLSLISIWYNNFFGYNTELVMVYNNFMSLFPYYLQQLVMESNGKCIDKNNCLIKDYKTSSILFGGLGTISQHSFFQLLHQGTYTVPIDFIIECDFKDNIYNSYYMLFSNFIAQSQSLAFGDNIFINNNKKKSNVFNFKSILGNKPNNVFLIKKINPYILGTLISIYEYKVFTQGIIWNICSYDQWGVNLGKNLSNFIYKLFFNNKSNIDKNKYFLDSSTLNLIKIFKNFNKFKK